MWKKQKAIDGVSAATSVLAETQNEVQRYKLAGEKRPKAVLSQKSQELYTAHKNKGVEERDSRDQAAHAAEAKTWDVAEAKLRAKSMLYEKMVRGEILETDEDKYMVDFEQKHFEFEVDSNNFYSEDMKREAARRKWEQQAEKELEEEELKKERIRMATELEEQTKEGRKRHLEIKEKRRRELNERLKLIKQKTTSLAAQEGQEQQQQEQANDEVQEPEEKRTKTESTIPDDQQVDQFVLMMKQGFKGKAS